MSMTPFLIPFINIETLLQFIIGSGVASQETDAYMRFTQALDNLENAKFYLESSKSYSQYRYRLFRVGRDTFIINVFASNGNEFAFTAGRFANQIAEEYLQEIFETNYDLRETEKLNMEIFKMMASSEGRDSNTVIGTGVFRENVPEYMKELLYIIPDKENSRPKDHNRPFNQNSQKAADSNLDGDDSNSVFQFKNTVESWFKIKIIDKNNRLISWLVKTSDGNIVTNY